ncbi:MAG: hypothetical protein AB7I25_12530 [Vicinamibacterales bacterium]
MPFPVEIWLRGDNHATTTAIEATAREPRAWTEGDVTQVLTAMLRAIDRAKHPDADPDRHVSLRGFSWIVNPFEGGVVIAIEMTLGAVVAGPFDVPADTLTGLIQRTLLPASISASTVVH